MKRTILKDVGIGLCFLLSTGTIYAQNYPKKVKNAQGIEVTYQSNLRSLPSNSAKVSRKRAKENT